MFSGGTPSQHSSCQQIGETELAEKVRLYRYELLTKSEGIMANMSVEQDCQTLDRKAGCFKYEKAEKQQATLYIALEQASLRSAPSSDYSRSKDQQGSLTTECKGKRITTQDLISSASIVSTATLPFSSHLSSISHLTSFLSPPFVWGCDQWTRGRIWSDQTKYR